MTMTFEKTKKQVEATRLMSGEAKHSMLYGGSRSGKTFIIVRNTIIRACKVPSRHISFRLKFNHAKTSLWLETIPKVLDLCFPDLDVNLRKADHYIEFPNGSEYWIAGLDDKERTEKVLGKEYSTIHFNECSQIPYESVEMAQTRLAEKNDLKKRFFYDENPPNKSHWSYWQFINKTNPETNELLNRPDDYGSILMNPSDNLQNIDSSYLEILEGMSSREQDRFMHGKFSEVPGGAIYWAYSKEKMSTDVVYNPNLPVIIGQDFNVDPMAGAVFQRVDGQFVCVDELFLRNSNTPELCNEIKRRYPKSKVIIRPDASGKNRSTKTSTSTSDVRILRDAGFEIQVKNKNPLRVDRWATTNRALEKGWVLINPSKAPNVVKDLERMIYKEGTSEPDKIGALRGHASDGFDYAVNWEYPMTGTIKISAYA